MQLKPFTSLQSKLIYTFLYWRSGCHLFDGFSSSRFSFAPFCFFFSMCPYPRYLILFHHLRADTLLIFYSRPPISLSTTAAHFGIFFFFFKLAQTYHMTALMPSFSKRSVLKRFPSKRKRNAGVFKFLQFEACFRKAPFS